jgi:methyltransferase (TIGR00027 family)
VIDELVTRELQAGATELVFLGAGFDTRAYRLEGMGGATVFELDHPATQARKRALGSGLVTRARAHHFIAADLEREDPRVPLVSAGFRMASRSAVLFEGVTMYLGWPAIERTLGALEALCAPGSALLLTYHDGSGSSGRASRSTALLARLLGEPFRTESSPSAMRALLAVHGFCVESDTGRDDWARAAARPARGRAHERLIVARRA